MAKMTDEEWQHLYENFETMDLLDAVSHIDAARSSLGDGPNFEPPELRTNLLKLHQMAMDVVNNGWTDKAYDMFMLAEDLDSEVFQTIENLEAVSKILSRLTDLFPESLTYGDE